MRRLDPGEGGAAPGEERGAAPGAGRGRSRLGLAPAAIGPCSGSGVGWHETTCQFAGAVTVKAKRALRSGWSKTGNIRRASATSNCV